MKQITGEGIAIIKTQQGEIDKLKLLIQQNEVSMLNIILNEKLRLNIPMEWAYNPQNASFLAPQEVPEGFTVTEIGPCKMPVLVQQQPQQAPQPGVVTVDDAANAEVEVVTPSKEGVE